MNIIKAALELKHLGIAHFITLSQAPNIRQY